MMSALEHKEVQKNHGLAACTLSLGEALGGLGGGAEFPLVEDPRRVDRTVILGMFVLRPARVAWRPAEDSIEFGAAADWCFNVRGVDGGWLIAGGNPLDAYRLALQYGLADAVIVGSNTVAKEGVDHGDQPGYLWQPYGPAAWPHLAAVDSRLADKIATVRMEWQRQGVLSSRRWPAQIVVSQSGEHRPPANDLFQARVFSALHPDGTPVETYVLTSEAGADRLRERAGQYDLGRPINEILVPVSPPGLPEVLDIANVPRELRRRFDIRLANHDGGQTVLSKFSEAGVMSQMNLTLMRNASVFDVLNRDPRLPAEQRQRMLNEFDTRRQLFFSGNHRLPEALKPISVLSDGGDALVVSFDARALRGL
jgi:hypothetical protein